MIDTTMIVLLVALWLAALGLLGFVGWSWLGRTPRARWWAGRTNRLAESMVLAIIPTAAAISLAFALLMTELVLGTNWLVWPAMPLLLAAIVPISFLRSGYPKWVIPRWARSTDRTNAWSNLPTAPGNVDPDGDARPAPQPALNEQWQLLGQRLRATIDQLDPGRTQLVIIDLLAAEGNQVQLRIGRRRVSAALPGAPFREAELAQRRIHARLTEEGWRPRDEFSWDFLDDGQDGVNQTVQAVLVALRLHGAEDPARVRYRAYLDTIAATRMLDLPELGLAKITPAVTDSFRADPPQVSAG